MTSFNFLKILKCRNCTALLILICSISIAAPCFSKNYYVSSSEGSDGNDGLTSKTAIKTLKKISFFAILPGDSILLKKGDQWNEKFKIQWSGSPGNPIIINAYGDGQKPKITGVITIDPANWNQVSGSGIYFIKIPRPYGVYQDGIKIIDDDRYNIPDGKNTSGNPTLTGSGGNWYYDRRASTLYYRPTRGVPRDHTVQYSPQSSGIYIEGRSFITIKNISISHVGGSAIYVNKSDHITVDNCDISYTFEQGIQFRYSRGYYIATNNNISHVGDGIYWMENNTGPNLAANNTISYCNHILGGSQYNNNDGHAIGMQNGDRFVVRDNIVSYTNMPAITMWVGSGQTGKDCVIKGNVVLAGNKKTYLKSYYGIGIAWHSTDADALTGSKLYGNIIKKSNGGFKLFSSHSPGAKVFNNTIYDCGEGFRFKKADNWILKNNLVTNTHDYQIFQENALVGTGNVFSNNLYYPDIPRGWKYRDDILSDFNAWQLATKQDEHSIIADPVLNSTASDDFTLKHISPAVDAGTWLTTVTSPSDFGTTFRVEDGSYFYDGYDIPGENGEKIKTQSGQMATIVEVSGNTITVNKPIRWTIGEGLALNYDGSSPDIGAREYKTSSSLNSPINIRILKNNS